MTNDDYSQPSVLHDAEKFPCLLWSEGHSASEGPPVSLFKGSGLRWMIALGFAAMMSVSSLGSVLIWDRYGESVKSKVKGYLQKPARVEPAAIEPVGGAPSANTQPNPFPDTQVIQWRTIRTHLQTLQIAHIQLSPNALPAIWALAEVGSNILFSTRWGRFGYLDESNRLHPLDLQTPTDIDSLRHSPILGDPAFDMAQVRTHDILSVRTGVNSFDLYASHYRFTGTCFQMVVSRARLVTGPEGIRVASPDWEEIYAVRPCIEIKDIGAPFSGLEGGGRLVLLDENTLLLSVGDHEFDGINGPYKAAMDPSMDLGKIIEISISQRSGRIYATGMRNPQGLLVAGDGSIWQTEHGPRGGDEVNLIRRGANYGWPEVTYGLQYGSPPTPWPYNPNQGQHQGYAKPRFAFVPSIGISNLIEPNATEFPLWDKHLLVGSLIARTLFALKMEGDSVVYVEPITIGERLRDIISLRDGRIAMLTDSAQLLLLRNAERYIGEPESMTVTGFSNLPPPDPMDIRDEGLPGEVWGARVFRYFCHSCHTVTGVTKVGPPLNGVLDRGIGAFPDYPYSQALTGVSGKWNRELMRIFVNRTDARFDDSTMLRVGLDDTQISELMAYLATTKAIPTSP